MRDISLRSGTEPEESAGMRVRNELVETKQSRKKSSIDAGNIYTVSLSLTGFDHEILLRPVEMRISSLRSRIGGKVEKCTWDGDE